MVHPSELTEETVQSLQKLAPFGMGNPEPVLAAKQQRASPRLLPNKTMGEPDHLKLSLEAAPKFDVIGFRFGEKAVLTEGPIDLAFQVSVEVFRGVSRLSLKLKDLRGCDASKSDPMPTAKNVAQPTIQLDSRAT